MKPILLHSGTIYTDSVPLDNIFINLYFLDEDGNSKALETHLQAFFSSK